MITHEADYCRDIAYCDPENSTCNGNCRNRRIWERLKAYEDTGLTPDEVVELKNKSTF